MTYFCMLLLSRRLMSQSFSFWLDFDLESFIQEHICLPSEIEIGLGEIQTLSFVIRICIRCNRGVLWDVDSLYRNSPSFFLEIRDISTELKTLPLCIDVTVDNWAWLRSC